ncbi:T9SS-dependent M36 family metallopeptidase [Weeksella virosa]|uniref:Peptidase M36 fungalysin n=1 Tax=Weeksella virosa (strain ATCC 43766 / DSM 16922 / JCM 21250 / CCUG 30538 / CDC 9751 / IAM 14551 / NBRC 16016 / NCTC 11634 / CL345/78) TaxID=865938 RepID=F0P248_WEEVC|nr:T9SS-dependent M36 family metallopeptidase [Weeksella virosa]ADX68776.1 peptidase M36 fungalysin [Weeksella virosa DSM 16922]VEH63551.1 Por secretion system C-terminal sorting domain [Weeksella virosa]
MKKKFLLLSTIVLMSQISLAQDHRNLIDQYLHQNQLSQASSSIQYQVVETIPNEKNSTERVYIQYEHNGIPIYNAYGNFLVQNNQVIHFAGMVDTQLNKPFPAQKSSLTDVVLLDKLASHFGVSVKENTKKSTETGVFPVDQHEVKLYYFLDQKNQYHLVKEFMVAVKTVNENDVYIALLDAHSGEILDLHNSTLSCDFHPDFHQNTTRIAEKRPSFDWLKEAFSTSENNPQYKVFPLPYESPSHGNAQTVNFSTVANVTASPEGWHKYGNKEEDATYGNNVRAAYDHNSTGYNTYSGASVTLDGKVYSKNGDYDFSYDYQFGKHPFKSKEAATVNLFYTNNMMHDIMYNYGFDEKSGNFQKSNFGNGGTGNDEVIALAQTRFNEGVLNNATFATLPDGYIARMAMYLWNPPTNYTENLVSIFSPSDIAGDYTAKEAQFGNKIDDQINANFILVKTTDGTNEGCSTPTNAAEINNNIAIITRGNCNFVTKVKNAQDAGAKGVIVVNNDNGVPIAMGGTDSSITIPSVMITKELGDKIKSKLNSNITVTGSLNASDTPYYDGSLDNGVIAHEYGHGISTRLTGPLTTSACLRNKEQMGEGWSDFFGYILTMQPEDKGTDARGIGTYVTDQPTTGRGIRPTAYSTDMSVNPATYDNLKTYGDSSNESPHRTGYVWATMLWDMTWKLIDKYGFSPDIYNGDKGNNISLQLVMDGMKNQPCNPGFVDGRDAILAADIANYNGENQCEIWQAFARRGLGYGASQGSSDSRVDGVSSFEMPPAEVLDCKTMNTTNYKLSSLYMFPNPAKDMVYFADENLGNSIKIEVSDVTGKSVMNAELKVKANRAEFDTSSLSKGLYILKITTNKEVTTKKLIKN